MDTIQAFINHPLFYWSLVILYVFSIVSTIVIILSENRNPVKSLAWLTILILLPLVGLILYFFFGRNIKNTRMISRRNKRKLKKNDIQWKIDYNTLEGNLTTESIQQIKLTHSLTGALFYPGNAVKIYSNGKEKFEALEKDLLTATKYIHIQYYIFESDEIGNHIKNILIKKATEGIKVRVIYDHIGSIHVKKRFINDMRDAGIEIFPFFKVAFPPFATRINWRNHRKLCIIDGEIGYIGGMNIADRYINGIKNGVWRDCHMRITGPAIRTLQYSFAVDWSFMGQPLIEEEIKAISNIENVGLQMATSGPTSQWPNIAFIFLKAITNAKKRIYIQTPYFLPTENLLKALQSAALSKVDVRIMIPRRPDSIIMRHASFSYVQECLNSGIKIYLYQAGMLHSKTMIIDDEFCTIGSTNFDFRSFEHNFEGNMFIYSKAINQQMIDIFNNDLAQSIRINSARWRKRPIFDKALASILRLLSPIL
ncbi:MAG: cardiolipin synthase [Muribaculaceae bacterium]|nr:cardiolipin synthase [Muribaculaceae bacterium]